VPDLPAPAPKVAETTHEDVSAPATVTKSRPARKTAAQRRAEKRAAAKRAAQLRAERRAAARRAAAEKRAVAARPVTKRSSAASSASRDSAASSKQAGAESGKGVLSIASSPLMQVWVDGRNSKATTPVRILLRTGKHKVTLIDTKAGTSRAFTVAIKDGETTTVSKRYR
jgi:hypothetical protein